MSVADELRSPGKTVPGSRTILGPAGNRVGVSKDEAKSKNGGVLKTPERPKKLNSEKVAAVKEIGVRSQKSVNTSSLNSSTSSDSSAGVMVLSPVNKTGRKLKRTETKSTSSSKVKSSPVSMPLKRCDQGRNQPMAGVGCGPDPLYVSFHDGEWGVPVRDDRKLFELFVLSIALAELTWPAILYKREIFRKHFDNFDPLLVAKFSEEEKLLSMKVNCSNLLSEPRLRAVVDNANQILKVQEEFGSLSNYFWRFIKHKPIQNGFRYVRQVPVKTPKSEAISKDLMQRGFRCVGPTVVYSFMQVSGMTNDHLITCFRYHECCNDNLKIDMKPKTVENNRSPV